MSIDLFGGCKWNEYKNGTMFVSTHRIFGLGFGNLKFPVGQRLVSWRCNSAVTRVAHSSWRQNRQVWLSNPRYLYGKIDFKQTKKSMMYTRQTRI